MRRALACRLGILVVSVLAALPAAAARQESWTAQYPLPAGGQVEVANVQGSIQVEGWDRSEVELTVIKTPADPAGGDVHILVEPGRNSLRVRTLYPGPTELPVQVDYRLRVPRQVRLDELRTVNGDILVRDVEGMVQAHTLNGDIEETGIAGSVVARTVNGDVSVRLRALPDAGGRLELDAINGDLTLLLPAEADADLELSTVAGQIESRLLFVAGGPEDDTALRAHLGRGGVAVHLRTIRGSIRVGSSEDVF